MRVLRANRYTEISLPRDLTPRIQLAECREIKIPLLISIFDDVEDKNQKRFFVLKKTVYSYKMKKTHGDDPLKDGATKWVSFPVAWHDKHGVL